MEAWCPAVAPGMNYLRQMLGLVLKGSSLVAGGESATSGVCLRHGQGRVGYMERFEHQLDAALLCWGMVFGVQRYRHLQRSRVASIGRWCLGTMLSGTDLFPAGDWSPFFWPWFWALRGFGPCTPTVFAEFAPLCQGDWTDQFIVCRTSKRLRLCPRLHLCLWPVRSLTWPSARRPSAGNERAT